MLPNDSLVIDTSFITLKFINNVDENQKACITDTLNLALFYTSNSSYCDYSLSAENNFIEIISSIDTSTIINEMIYSVRIPVYIEPNDPYYENSPNAPNDEINYYWNYYVMKLEDAWDKTTGNSDIKVAILGLGIDVNHDDLGDEYQGYSNIDIQSQAFLPGVTEIDEPATSSHGTWECSIIGAKLNNGTGVASIAGGWGNVGVSMLICVVRDNSVQINSTAVDNAIEHAIDCGARIISITWGAPPPFNDPAIESAINKALDNGLLVFSAAGNENWDYVSFPANIEEVIAVGATGYNYWEDVYDPELQDFVRHYDEERAEWEGDGHKGSNYGNDLSICAPTFVTVAQNLDYYPYIEYVYNKPGTSMSTPQAAGIAALMLSVNPCLSTEEVKRILFQTADKINAEVYEYSWNEEWETTRCYDLGFGRINAKNAVQAVNDLMVPDYSIDDSPTWSNELYYSCGNIEILRGGSLTLGPDVILKMGENCKIAIHQGGELIVNGATITSYVGSSWKGIEVYGNTYLSQTPLNQGVCVINGGTIQYAICGVTTAKMDEPHSDGTPIYLHDYSGGIIVANRAHFEYNVTAVRFYPYPGENISYFDSCVFITNYEPIIDMDPDYFVKMFGVNGIEYVGCIFENENGPGSNENNGGIYSFSSSFSIDRKCIDDVQPCDEWQKSHFKNLYYAIYANSALPTKIADIRHTLFEGNKRGVYLCTMDNARITSNEFQTKYSASDDCYGLYLDDCSEYWVEDNDFIGTGSSSSGIGIVVNKSGPRYNEIYNNRFYDVENGVLAQNVNRSIETGLEILCNDFDNCENDIGVTSTIKTGIAPNQGSDTDTLIAPAGNRFSYANNNTPSDYNNEGTNLIYFYHSEDFDLYLKPQYYYGIYLELNPQDWDKQDCCPPNIESGGGSRETLKDIIVYADQKIDSTQTLLQQLVDAGDTEEFTEDIDYSFPDESMEIYNDLMNTSPYLSDSVLASAIANEDVLPNAMIRDIMVANPQSAKQDSLIEKVGDRWDEMPDYMMDEILQGRSLIGAKEELESEKAFYIRRRSNAFKTLVRSYLEDTISQIAKLDSLIQILNNETSLHLNYLLSFLYFETGQYSEGEYHLDSIPLQVMLSGPEQSEHNALEDYYSLLTDMVEDSTTIIFPDSLQVEELFDIYDSGTGRAFVFVRSILHSNNEIVYEEPIILPDPYKTAEMFNFTDPSLIGKRGNSMLKIYPNPTSGTNIMENQIE